MKNLENVWSTQSCYYCKQNGFFCYKTPESEYHTCPICGHSDLKSLDHNHLFLLENEYINDIRNIYSYCIHCNVVYNLGCLQIGRAHV